MKIIGFVVLFLLAVALLLPLGSDAEASPCNLLLQMGEDPACPTQGGNCCGDVYPCPGTDPCDN